MAGTHQILDLPDLSRALSGALSRALSRALTGHARLQHVAEKDFPSSPAFMIEILNEAGLDVNVLHDDNFYYVLLKGTKRQ